MSPDAAGRLAERDEINERIARDALTWERFHEYTPPPPSPDTPAKEEPCR